MNMLYSMALIEKYAACYECGNEFVGDGEGTLEITENTFRRSCKCGWGIEVSVGDTK